METVAAILARRVDEYEEAFASARDCMSDIADKAKNDGNNDRFNAIIECRALINRLDPALKEDN